MAAAKISKAHAHTKHVFTESAVTLATRKGAEILPPDTLFIPKKQMGAAKSAFEKNLKGKVIVINTERLPIGKDGLGHLLGHIESWMWGNNTLIRQGVPFGQTLVGMGDQPIDIYVFAENPNMRKKDAERTCNIVRATNPGVKIIFITSIPEPKRLKDVFAEKGEPYDVAYCPSTRYTERLPRMGKFRWKPDEIDAKFIAAVNCLYAPEPCGGEPAPKPKL